MSEHIIDDDIGDLLAKNSGSLGIDGEMLDALRGKNNRESSSVQEKPTIGLDQIRWIMINGVVLRCARGELGLKEAIEGARGDALAIFNTLAFLDKPEKPHLWKFIEQTKQDIETIKDIDLERYRDAIIRHIQRSVLIDLGKVYASTDTFDLVFSDVDKIQRNLPVVSLIKLGQLPPLPYDVREYDGFGKIGSDKQFKPEQFVQSATVTTQELEAIWDKLKDRLSGVPLVDKKKEDHYWGQELLFNEIVGTYMSKLVTYLFQQKN